MYLEFDEQDHRYFADGIELPSVTQVLDAAGHISQFCKDDQARWRGVSVHALAAEDDKTHLDLRTVPVELRGYLRAWRKYKMESGFQVEQIEKRVDSPVGYSGRLDRTGFLPQSKLLFILDLKTSKSGAVASYVKYQLAAYAFAENPRSIFNRVAVALMPDGNYRCKVYQIEDLQIDIAEFLTMVKNYGKQ